ncbi:inositol-phosphate transport system substrate-binding protein [Caldalkalibacillus uzonensis]|uniref:Inositol-phosphate transport system substrate-binding protein n=1 Tax=Caldalkalibacillus uzonensis TaxID=353224 RepID=A0ABU0CQ68_9BACI|nr:extracellular solute-binding protein [Caldalkalibacillus uzonensis]MDQ0338560.1 inositol-phosphate transport system substrate-binding protein [Caldalkalibacillus uzonensis]
MGKLQHWLIIVLCLGFTFTALAGCSTSEPAAGDQPEVQKNDEVDVVTITAQAPSPETTRVDNLVRAAEMLNEELEKEGQNIRVEVETQMFEGSWEDYARQFMLAFQSGKEPDIYVASHPNTGWLADGGYIQPLDELKESEAYADVYPVLWDAVTYKGHVWGAVQDTEARPVFYNKNILRELGWSEEEIERLPEKVKIGEFTLNDLIQVAEEAVSSGTAKYGIVHRPVNGPDFQVMLYNFGGTLYDPEENKIVFDKEAVLKQLSFFHEIAQKKLIPEGLLSMEWSNIHSMVVNGEVLFYFGGIWNIFNWGEDNFHKELGKVDPEWVMENFGMMLYPAAEEGGQALTLSHPFAYFVSANAEHKELIIRLLEHVIHPDLQTTHNVETYHLPVTESAANHPDYQANITLGEIAYMTQYTTFLPNHEGYEPYSNAVFKAIEAVQLGRQTPQEALEALEVQLKNDLRDQLSIVE